MYKISLGDKQLVLGDSSETKPTSLTTGSQFLAMDTGDFYIFNGSAWNIKTNKVTVLSVADFPAPVAGVITLADNVTYLINGNVDIGTNVIVFGIRNAIVGKDRLNDKLVSQTTGTMMTIDSTTVPKLSMTFNEVTLSCPNGTLINAIKTSISFVQVSFASVKTFGNTADCPSTSFRACGINNITTGGLTFTGTCGTLRVLVNVISNNAGTLLSLGTATFTMALIDANVITVNATQTFLSGTTLGANMTGEGVVSSNALLGAGTFVSGITAQDLNWFFVNNQKTVNTKLNLAKGESLAESTNATTTYANKLSVTYTPYVATDFVLTWYYEYAQSNNNKGVEVRIQSDGVDVGNLLETNLNNGDYLSQSGFVVLPLTVAAHTFTLDFRENGGGTAKIRKARLRLVNG